MPTSDDITILHARGANLLTKTFVLTDEGLEKRVWGNVKFFDVEQRPVDGLRSLSDTLAAIQADPSVMVVRGGLKTGIQGTRVVRQCRGLDAPFEPKPHCWVCLDIDDVPLPPELADFNSHTDEIVALACSTLPPEFHGVDCHWQFSSSMGVTPGRIKLHLWFWLSEPVSDGELKAWTGDREIDQALFNAVQAHYTAAPIFEPPEANPVNVRSGIYRAGRDVAAVPVPPDLGDRIVARKRSRTKPRNVVRGDLDPQEVVRDSQGKVVDGRETFLWRRSIEATAQLTKGGKVPTADELTALTWELYSAEAHLTDGRWTQAHARDKAEARLREVAAGLPFSARSQSHVLVPDLEPYFDISPVSLPAGVELMEEALGGFFKAVIAGQQKKMVLRITMGVGKTTQTVKHLLRAFNENPRLNVAIYTRRHGLADELVERLGSLSDSVDVVHVRGRNADGPDGTPMCQRSVFVKSLADQGISIRPNACFRDQEHQCEFYGNCRYWRQFAPTLQLVLGSVRIYPHDYLALPREDGEPIPDLVIIDEGFIDKLRETFELPLEIIRNGFLMDEETHVGNQLAAAIRSAGPVLSILRREHVDASWFRKRRSQEAAEIPFQGSGNVAVGAPGNALNGHRRAKAALAEVLLEEMATNTGREGAERVRFNPASNSVVIDRLRPLRIPDAASVLVLDATASELLMTTVIGPVDFQRIDVEQKAYVTQVYDRTGSNVSWDRNEDNVDDLVYLLSERAKAEERVLCISHKGLDDRLRTMDLPPNVSTDHFGNLRGSNEYEHFDTIVITGRNQPPQTDIDGLARAIFWREDQPLQHDAAASFGAPPSTDLPSEIRGYLTTDPNMKFGISVRSFSDPRIEAVHAQFREAETVQAIARLRLVRAKNPKRVFLLGNLPIELPVDQLVEWNELMPDWAERELRERGDIPLTPKGLLKMRPDLFDTESKAKDGVKRSRLSDPSSLLLASPSFARLSFVVVTFRQLVNGRAYGTKQSHLFGLIGDADEASGDVDSWKSVLETGYIGIDGSGWGPVAVLDVEWSRPGEGTTIAYGDAIPNIEQ